MLRRTALGLALLAVAGVAACATRVVPPAGVAAPAKVAIIDHGRHTSLAVELPDGSAVRYAYGQWDWYALGKTGAFEGVRALFAGTQGALGRRHLPGPVEPAALAGQLGATVEEIVVIEVDADAADRLVQRLDADFRAAPGPPLYQPQAGLAFVPQGGDYSLAHNSNQVVAGWLEDLGCRIEGPRTLASWRVQAPAGGSGS